MNRECRNFQECPIEIERDGRLLRLLPILYSNVLYQRYKNAKQEREREQQVREDAVKAVIKRQTTLQLINACIHIHISEERTYHTVFFALLQSNIHNIDRKRKLKLRGSILKNIPTLLVFLTFFLLPMYQHKKKKTKSFLCSFYYLRYPSLLITRRLFFSLFFFVL